MTARRVKSRVAAMTADDVKLWLKLVSRARAVAVNPQASAVGFVQAAEKAGKAVAPEGFRDAGSPFIALVRLGKRFLLLTLIERGDTAGDIATWSDAIADTLVLNATDQSDREAAAYLARRQSPPSNVTRLPYRED